MSQKVASAALAEVLDGSGLYTEERNPALWQQVPSELRLQEFSPRTLPDHPAFRWRLGCRPEWRGFDLGPLPEPMQRDFAYCLWRVVDSGLTITAPYALLVNWFIHLAQEPKLAGRPPLRSLIDRSVSEWEHELVRERARRRGKLGWPKFGPGIFRRSYRHLLIAYARVVAARRLEPTVRRPDPPARSRAGRGARRLRLHGDRAAMAARGAQVAAEDRA
jgi:hypothetical protein